MKKYLLTGEVTISVYTEIVANSKEEALEEAYSRDITSSDWQGLNEFESWVSDGYDGLVENINIEEDDNTEK